VFRNGVATYHPFVGQQGFFSTQPMDSLVITNNSYVNNQSYWMYQGGQGLVDYILFEHNTVYTSLINTLAAPEAIDAHFRSNLFYGESAYGDTQFSKDNHWYTSEGSELATMYFRPVINQDLLTAKGLTEADRIIDISNNAYFTPQAIKDYHDAHSDATDATDNVTGAAWMNSITQGMFDDATAYPNLTEANNVEVDPLFKNLDTEDYLVDELSIQCEELFSSKAAGKGWGANSSRRNFDEHLGGGDFMLVDWPLVEGNLEYTEASLMAAGHDGMPVGDLNWDASKRDQYAYPAGVGGFLGLSMFGGSLSNDNFDFTSKGYELSSYPNPATTTANISFKLPKKANVTISVYSIMGQKIQTITNGSFAKGNHTVEWDASNVASGLYIYKLDTDEVSQSRQLIITK
ncbi:MAG: T9SS type A sorting domain-containing protein, partial [Flavobacteriales bacterium]|nr:T9SS type A sorting domain-containing protein [Flavobacteriales bacterium]